MDRRTVDRVVKFAKESSNTRHAKFAARLLPCMKNAEQLCEEVVEVRIFPVFSLQGQHF